MIIPKLIICPINKVMEILQSGKANAVLSLLSKAEVDKFYNTTGENLQEVFDYEYKPGNNFYGIEKYVKNGDWKIVTMEDNREAIDTPDAPDADNVGEAISFAIKKINEGKHLIIHCQMGFSRSPAIAFLVLCHYTDPQSAINEIYSIRPNISPNKNIIAIGDKLLGLNGAAIKAADDRNQVRRAIKESFDGWFKY